MSAASAARSPLAARNGDVSSASVVKFAAGTADKPAPKAAPARGLNVVPSFSVMSSGLPSSIMAEELILKGAKKKPVGGQTMDTFYKSITHLHFANQRLLEDVAAITLCSNLRVLYVYENRLTTLRGLGGLQRLTHLYAQENHIESLDDFEAPPALLQLHLTGNRLRTIGGLELCRRATNCAIFRHDEAPEHLLALGLQRERRRRRCGLLPLFFRRGLFLRL